MLRRGKFSWAILIGPLYVFVFHSEGKRTLGPEKIAKIASKFSGIGDLRWSLDIEGWQFGRKHSSSKRGK